MVKDLHNPKFSCTFAEVIIKTNSMSLDFNNTCPQIDDCIEEFKHYSEQFIISLIEHFIPTDLQDENNWRFKNFVEDRLKEHNSDILPLFEKLRELNSDMRSVADKQIGDLEDRISEQEEYISELEKQSNYD